MRFTVSTQVLQRGLSTISGSIGTNSVLPILDDFLFRLEGNTLKVLASDLQTSMLVDIPVVATEGGIVAVPARILLDTLKALPDQPLEFEVDNESYLVNIVSETGSYSLAGENAEDFPEIPTDTASDRIALDATTLAEALGRSLFAVSSDELRLAMTGINVEIDEGGMRLIATDAHKLVKYTNKQAKITGYANFIVPKKSGTLLKNALANAVGDLEMSWNDTHAFFSVEGLQMVCALIDGKFPDVTPIIPTNNPNELTINRVDFQSALKRISIFASKTTYQVLMDIKMSSVQLFAEDLDYSNKAAEHVVCQYHGNDMQIAFNARFLIELLGNIDTEQVRMQLSTPSRAGLVLPGEETEGEELFMLVMPIMMNR
ncbi:DNA polymerase III subunit beta [Chitinophagales bacterium]|nr:DNA polymerase III subunit beta [Chitinophagales bacterium]